MKSLLMVILLGLCSCTTLPRALEPVAVNGRGPSADIHVVSHGKHTGLIVGAASLNRVLPELGERFAEAPYYEIGWGDAGFYRAEEITTRLTLDAVFRPTPTVVHVVALDKDPSQAFPHSKVVRLSVAEANHEVLLRFIRSSFELDAEGRAMSEGRGIYGDSEFYRGIGRYFLCNTCNKWTAKGLYSAGIDVDPASPISSADVMKQLGPE